MQSVTSALNDMYFKIDDIQCNTCRVYLQLLYLNFRLNLTIVSLLWLYLSYLKREGLNYEDSDFENIFMERITCHIITKYHIEKY
jgi:hypothetical protein